MSTIRRIFFRAAPRAGSTPTDATNAHRARDDPVLRTSASNSVRAKHIKKRHFMRTDFLRAATRAQRDAIATKLMRDRSAPFLGPSTGRRSATRLGVAPVDLRKTAQTFPRP